MHHSVCAAVSMTIAVLAMGCAVSPQVIYGEPFEHPARASKSFARLYVFRPDFSERNRADEPVLIIDGNLTSVLSVDSYADLELSPGSHTVSVKPGPFSSSIWNGEIVVSLEPDSVSFLAVWNTTESVAGYANIFIPGPSPLLVPVVPVVSSRSSGVALELVKEGDAMPHMKGRRSARIPASAAHK
jgi:hypothetical protein